MKMKLSWFEVALVGIISVILVVVAFNVSKKDDVANLRKPRASAPTVTEDDFDDGDVNSIASFGMPSDGRTVGEVTGSRSAFSLDGKSYAGVAFTEDGVPYYIKDGPGSVKGIDLDSPGLSRDKLPDALDSLRALTELADPDPKALAFVMQKLDLEQLPEALALVQSMVWGPQALDVMKKLMARWGELDPAQAIDHAKSLASRRASSDALRYALNGWAKADPDAALGWLTENYGEDQHMAHRSTYSLFATLAKNDITGACESALDLESVQMKRSAVRAVIRKMTKENSEAIIEFYDSMPTGKDKEMMGGAILRQWRELQPEMEEAFALFDKMESEQNKKYAASLIARNWAVYQPEMVGEWVNEIGDDKTKRYAMDRLVDTWAYDQPLGAASWVSQLDEEDQTPQIQRVVSRWARHDTDAAEAWLTTFPPSPRLDDAASSLARSFSRKEPTKAVEWANTITDDKKRTDTIYNVARGWLQTDFKEATVFVATSDLSEAQKKKLLNSAGSTDSSNESYWRGSRHRWH
jgi:hypothetical protein